MREYTEDCGEDASGKFFGWGQIEQSKRVRACITGIEESKVDWKQVDRKETDTRIICFSSLFLLFLHNKTNKNCKRFSVNVLSALRPPLSKKKNLNELCSLFWNDYVIAIKSDFGFHHS